MVWRFLTYEVTDIRWVQHVRKSLILFLAIVNSNYYVVDDGRHIHCVMENVKLGQNTWKELLILWGFGSYMTWITKVYSLPKILEYLEGHGEVETNISIIPDNPKLEMFM